MKHVMPKYTCVQNDVEKNQNKADLMTKSHIRSTQKIESRSRQNKEVKMQCESICNNEEEMRTRRQVKKCEIK